jgi:hypothetical protein
MDLRKFIKFLQTGPSSNISNHIEYIILPPPPSISMQLAQAKASVAYYETLLEYQPSEERCEECPRIPDYSKVIVERDQLRVVNRQSKEVIVRLREQIRKLEERTFLLEDDGK